MPVSAIKTAHAEPKAYAADVPAAVRAEETLRVKRVAHPEDLKPTPVPPAASPAATSTSAVRDVVASLKKGG